MDGQGDEKRFVLVNLFLQTTMRWRHICIFFAVVDVCVLDKLFKLVCWFVLVSGLCFENSLQIILAILFEFCGDSV